MMNDALREILQPHIDYLRVVKQMALSGEGVFVESAGSVTVNNITLTRDEFDRLVGVICMDEPDKYKLEMFVVAKES